LDLLIESGGYSSGLACPIAIFRCAKEEDRVAVGPAIQALGGSLAVWPDAGMGRRA
jgi:hypothetical protein